MKVAHGHGPLHQWFRDTGGRCFLLIYSKVRSLEDANYCPLYITRSIMYGKYSSHLFFTSRLEQVDERLLLDDYDWHRGDARRLEQGAHRCHDLVKAPGKPSQSHDHVYLGKAGYKGESHVTRV